MSENYYSDSTNTNIIPIIKVGEVISIKDNTKSGRIKVSITGVDDLSTEGNLIDCVPLLPKYLVTLPKVGECVFIFVYEHKSGPPTASFSSKRFWIGPLITQPTTLDGEHYNKSLSILPDGYTKLKDPKIEEGTYGNDEDIILQGRYNTDIIQKDRQIWLRLGKFKEGKPNKFNSKNMGYIQLKYGGEKLKREIVDREYITYITPNPTTNISVKIDTITNAGVPLSPDLPKERYKKDDIDRTDLFISVTDIKSTVIKNVFEQQFNNGALSRQSALDAAKTFIDINKGSRWQLKSTANDIVKIYKGTGSKATFTATPIEVKKNIPEVKFTTKNDPNTSIVNVVANKINLLSHDGPKSFELADPKGLITDYEQEKINNDAHPLVYGDTLVEFLELVKKYVISHVHPYNGLPADPSKTTTDVMGFNLNTILNKNINSN